jgi:hypothetical protein
MRVSIIPTDGVVVVEGQAEAVDCSAVAADVHAVQWYGALGEVEFIYVPGEQFRCNEVITDFAPYQSIVDLWVTEAKKPAPPTFSATPIAGVSNVAS